MDEDAGSWNDLVVMTVWILVFAGGGKLLSVLIFEPIIEPLLRSIKPTPEGAKKSAVGQLLGGIAVMLGALGFLWAVSVTSIYICTSLGLLR